MTDARIPGHWVGDLKYDNLGVGAWALLTRALAWSNERGTDGFIPDRYLQATVMLPGHTDEDAAELARAGLWKRVENGWQFLSWAESPHKGGLGQRTSEEVKKQKSDAAERQRAFRERKKLHESGDHSQCSAARCEIMREAVVREPGPGRDVPRRVTRDVGEGKGYYEVTPLVRNSAREGDDGSEGLGWLAPPEDLEDFPVEEFPIGARRSLPVELSSMTDEKLFERVEARIGASNPDGAPSPEMGVGSQEGWSQHVHEAWCDRGHAWNNGVTCESSRSLNEAQRPPSRELGEHLPDAR